MDSKKFDNEVVNQCFKAVQDLLKTNAMLFDRNSSLRKMTPESTRNLLATYQGYLKNDLAFDVQAVFFESVMTFLEYKSKPGKVINDDYNYLFMLFRNRVFYIGKKSMTNPGVRLDEDKPFPDLADIEIDSPFYFDLNILDILFKRKEFKKGGDFEFSIKEVSTFYNKLFYEWNYSDINKALNINEDTLKSHLVRIKQKIRKFVENNRSELTDLTTEPN